MTDLFTLECFRALANTGKFSDAADSMYISQSSFSNQIASFEKDLGVKLFDRSQKGTFLTPAGEEILPFVTDILAARSGARDKLAAYMSNRQNVLRVYTHAYMTMYGITEFIRIFSKLNPDIQIEIHETETNYAIENLKRYPNSAGIVFCDPSAPYSGLESSLLMQDEIVAVVGTKNRFYGRSSLPLAMLRDETLQIVSIQQDPWLHSFIYGMCTDNGFAPRLTTVNLWITTLPIIINRYNVVPLLVHSVAARFRTPDMHIIRLTGTRPIGIAAVSGFDTVCSTGDRFMSFAHQYKFPV